MKKSDFTRKEAYEILGSSKEQAENLMIVDLIRQCASLCAQMTTVLQVLTYYTVT